jgi:glycosyltransferase involved in cell wall biosynthesis
MGVKAEIFKFPLFYCVSGTELFEEGNHYPPLGFEPRDAGILGVTHHFKFRRIFSGRLEKRINSPHLWRYESVGFRDYLQGHAGRVPFEGTFPYSREELFRRRLLRQLPVSKPAGQNSKAPLAVEPRTIPANAFESTKKVAVRRDGKPVAAPKPGGKRTMFVLPKTTEFGAPERSLLELLRRLPEPLLPPLIVCFGQDIITAHLDENQQAQVIVKCVEEPQSLWDWIRIIRESKPDIIVFDYCRIEAFPWQAPIASLLAGVGRRISIQRLISPLPSPVPGKSPRDRLRRWIGRRARYVLRAKISARLIAHVCSKTVCVNEAVRDALAKIYGFPARKTVVIFNGVSTSNFTPSQTNRAAVRARLDIDCEEFLLVCAATLAEASGLDILIRAVARIVHQGVPCKCIIIGDGPLKAELIRLVNSLGLAFHVFFEGNQKDVRPYLHAGSAFILTSTRSMPISILEAMACGLPCIVTNLDGSAEIVEDHVSGLLIPPGSVEAAADAILSLATNPDTCAGLAGKAREAVCKSFDIEQTMPELIRVITNSAMPEKPRCGPSASPKDVRI